MAIVAVLPGHNLFSSPPPNPRINESLPSTSKPPSPPIPIPKYPKTQKSQKSLKSSQQYDKPPDKSPNPAFKAVHRRTKYYKPVTDGVIASEEGRSVVIGESGVSYLLPGAPFEFQFSYSETPKVKPLAIREPAFLPFAPPTMPRPWTGKSPLKQSKKKIPLLESFNLPSPETKGLKRLEMPRPFSLAKFPNGGKTREEVLGKPLTKSEIRMLVKPHLAHNRQVNVGRDGLTHNMLELIHSHWRRESVCKVRCRGVPTVDMNNVCHHLEEKTGGKIIHQVGGFVYLFRGRNYDYKTRPRYPTMLWKPAAPVYPKLIQEVPEGLTKVEADDLRVKGKNLLPICKLAKNGVYINLVKDVRDAFEESSLAKIDCRGMHASDYKKVGAKLKELVPGVLLSFDEAQILMWRGKDWKLMYPETRSLVSDNHSSDKKIASSLHGSGESDDGSCQPVLKDVNNRMISLWKHAIESSKALPLEAIDLGPDDLLEKVELFERMSQATEHSYPALVLSNEDDHSSSEMEHNDGTQHEAVKDEDIYEDGDDEECVNDPFGEVDFPLRVGSLPVDLIAKRLQRE